MKNTIWKLAASAKAVALALILMTTTSVAAAAQDDKPWTTIGSAGTVDESGQMTFTDNIAYLDSDSAVIRYNVVAVDGLFNDGLQAAFPRMTVRFRDNGSNNRVIVRLKRAPIDGGNSVTVLRLDSNDYAGSSSFQTQSVTACGDEAFSFDFASYAYYIEVTMSRTSLPVTPGLASIKLDLSGICIALPR
jgi:hypothetical protein